jgi:hypothetical protein
MWIRALKVFLALLVLSFVFTLASLRTYGSVSRYEVDPEGTIDSETVAARGFPLPFLADDPAKPNFGSVGLQDKFLLNNFVWSWIFFFISLLLISLLIFGFVWIVRSIHAKYQNLPGRHAV